MKSKGVVAAGHELTARAAEMILREGGNAFDAILAATCAACVTEPVLCSLGGGGFLLAQTGDGRSCVYDFFVHTPKARRPVEQLDFEEVIADFGTAQQLFHIGLGSIATPGAVRGVFEIHRELGSVPMKEIVAPAISFARDGVRLDPLQAYIFSIVEKIYTATPEARAVWGSSSRPGRLVGGGELLRQPQVGDTLEILAIEGDDLFYRGEIARTLVEQCRDGGGCLAMEDLEQYRVERRSPLAVDYRDNRLLTNPPPSSGGLLIAFALKLLESVRLHEHPFGSRGYLELLALVIQLTDKARVDAHLDETTVCPSAAQLLDEALLERYRNEVRGRAEALRGTTHINVMDDRDNVATLTLSNGEGCGHLIPGTGIMPNNMLGEEDLSPHGFHCWEPDQRMTSMMAPSMLLCPGGRRIATGSGGSKRIRSAIVQVLVNLVDHGMSTEDAVSSPRVVLEEQRLSVEGGFRDRELAGLLERYPEHQLWEDVNLYFGGAHTVESRRGIFEGAGDPRRGGVCTVVS